MTNLIAWGIQVTLLVALGAAASRMLGNAKARLWFWQGLLVIAILLPLVQPWKQPLPEALIDVPVPISKAPVEAIQYVEPAYWERLGWMDLLIAGAGIRFAWLAVGLWRLRRLRSQARAIGAPIAVYGDAVKWYASDGITGPVTFGRTVMLPERVLEMPEEMRYSIARHELLHVERGDWWFVMAEETLRGVLWFHPAVWFALGQVQLSREQVVDREVVDATKNQASYLEALVAVAAQKMRSDLAPAPLFLKKRQLAVRVAAVMKEGPMSKKMLMGRSAAAACAITAAIAVGVWMFPLVGSAQMLPDGPGVTVDAGAALLHRTPVYATSRSAGTVVVDVTLDTKGEPTDARVVSGLDELRKSVLTNVLNWHFTPGPATARVTVNFAGQAVLAQAPPPPPPPPPPVPGGFVAPPPPPPPPPPGYAKIGSISYQNMSKDLEERIQRALGLHVGDPFPDARTLTPNLRAVDAHLSWFFRAQSDGTVAMTFSAGPSGAIGAPPAPPAPPVPGARGGFGGGTFAIGAPATVVAIQALGLSPELTERAIEAVGLRIGDRIPSGWNPAPRLQAIDARLRAYAPVSNGDQATIILKLDGQTGTAEPPPGTQRISPGVAKGMLLSQVPPVYPPIAKQARVQGAIVLSVVIGESGTVEQLSTVSGPTMLRDAAMDAVRQWTYRPMMLNGRATKVVTEVEVNFSLQQ